MAPAHSQLFFHLVPRPGFPGQHRRPGGAGLGGSGVGGRSVTLWSCPLTPLRPLIPLCSAKPRVGQGYTDQRVKSAFHLPGAVFQEREGLIQANSSTPTWTGRMGRTGTCPALSLTSSGTSHILEAQTYLRPSSKKAPQDGETPLTRGPERPPSSPSIL